MRLPIGLGWLGAIAVLLGLPRAHATPARKCGNCTACVSDGHGTVSSFNTSLLAAYQRSSHNYLAGRNAVSLSWCYTHSLCARLGTRSSRADTSDRHDRSSPPTQAFALPPPRSSPTSPAQSSGASVFVSACGGMSSMPQQKQFHGSRCPDGTDVCVCSAALGSKCVAATFVDTPWEWQANSTPQWGALQQRRSLPRLRPWLSRFGAGGSQSVSDPSVVSLNATGSACPLRANATWRVWVGLRCDASQYGFATGTPTLSSPAGCCLPPLPPVNGTAGRNHSTSPPLTADPCAVLVDWRTSYVCTPFPSAQESRLVEMMPGGARKPAPDQLALKAGTALDPPLGMQFRDQFRADGRPNSSRPAVLLQSNCSDDVLIAVCPTGRIDSTGSAALFLTSPAQAYGFQNTSCNVNVSMAASASGGGPVPAWPGSDTTPDPAGRRTADRAVGSGALREWINSVLGSAAVWTSPTSAGDDVVPSGGSSPRVCVGEAASAWLLASMRDAGALVLPPCPLAFGRPAGASAVATGSQAGRRGLGTVSPPHQEGQRSSSKAVVPGILACVAATSGAGGHAWAHVRFTSASEGVAAEVGVVLPTHASWIGRHADGRRPGAPFGRPIGPPPSAARGSDDGNAGHDEVRRSVAASDMRATSPAVVLALWGAQERGELEAGEARGVLGTGLAHAERTVDASRPPRPLPPGQVWMHAATAVAVVMPAPLGPQGPGGLSASELAAIVVGSVLGIAAVVGIGFAVRRNTCTRRGAFRLPTTWRRDATLDRTRGLLEQDGTYVSRHQGSPRKGSGRGMIVAATSRAHGSDSLWDKQLGSGPRRGGGAGGAQSSRQFPDALARATGAYAGGFSGRSSVSSLGARDRGVGSTGASTAELGHALASGVRRGGGTSGHRQGDPSARDGRDVDRDVMRAALRGTGLDAHALAQQNILPMDDEDDESDFDGDTAEGASDDGLRHADASGAAQDLVSLQGRQVFGSPRRLTHASGSDNDVLSLE